MATAPIRIRAPLNSTRPPTTVTASVTFDMMSRTVTRISWKSITDTFGNLSTRSCWNFARAADDLLVALEAIPVGDGVLAPQSSSCAHVLVRLEVGRASGHAGHARA